MRTLLPFDMRPLYKKFIIAGTFALIALIGLLISFSAPYVSSNDELTYLIGALQAKDGNLPDAYMLQGMDFGPYLYPKIMSLWYEPLGHYAFKSIYLITLIFTIGLSAYAMFRLLWLPWVPSLLLAVVALMPRFSSGLEIFGVLTFRDAIGRASALPLFFLGTGLLVRRAMENKSLWPIFAIFGFLVFLHPVTVILFTAVSLVAVSALMAWRHISLLGILKEVVLSGIAFVAAGSYLFVEVFSRLSHGVASAGVSSASYVAAIEMRNAWEFIPGSTDWFPHMAIVSGVFVLLVAGYFTPALRPLRLKYPFPHAGAILIWGITIAVASIALTVAIPAANLYFMKYFDAPYIFQQWSRISKFYYLGLFVAAIPVVYVLWQWYLESRFRFKSVIGALFVAIGIMSSSFGFEVAQYFVGYKNFEKGYIPQMFSGIPDDPTPEEYRESCRALTRLGTTPQSSIVSGNFALRYYCRADLFVTFEEGGAYEQLSRSDLVAWHKNYLEQRDALRATSDGKEDLKRINNFSGKVGGEFVVLPRTLSYEALEAAAAAKDVKTATTARHIILKVR